MTLRQPDAGDLLGLPAQPGQVADQAAADADGDDERGDDGRRQPSTPAAPAWTSTLRGGGLHALLVAVARTASSMRLQVVEHGGGDVVPAAGADDVGGAVRPRAAMIASS